MTTNPQRIVGLKAENFKRLQAVEIAPDGNTVILSGKNAQGKSSVLDSIWWALGGGAAGKKITNPIRNGATKATAEVTLDDFVVTRTASVDKKTTTLTVTRRDGSKVSSPQKVLDEMIGKLTFDPLEFSRLAAKEQREYLLNAVDLSIDLDAHESQRAELFNERTYVNRQVKELEAQVAGVEIPSYIPEPVDTAALVAELNDIRNGEHAVGVARTAVEGWTEKVSRLQKELLDAQTELAYSKQKYKEVGDIFGAMRSITEVEAEIASAAEVNALAGKIQQKKALEEQHTAKAEAAAKLTAELAALDKAKADALASAAMPIEGLSIDGETVTYQGQPLAQASSAEQTKVAFAIAVALNPTLRIAYIRDGSLLDSDSMDVVKMIAEQCDMQVRVEVVGDGGDAAILIEDGQVSDGLW